MPSQKRALETKSRILEAALSCFSREGYEATGVAEICRAAGVSKGAFYFHFPSKHDVFLSLLETWLAGVDRQLAELLAAAPSVPEGLINMAHIVPSLFETAKGQLPLFLEFWRQASRDPQVWKATVAPYRRYQQSFATLIETGVREGSLRQVAPLVTGQVIVSLAIGLLLQGVLDPAGGNWAEVAEEGVKLVLDGIRTDS